MLNPQGNHGTNLSWKDGIFKVENKKLFSRVLFMASVLCIMQISIVWKVLKKKCWNEMENIGKCKQKGKCIISCFYSKLTPINSSC